MIIARSHIILATLTLPLVAIACGGGSSESTASPASSPGTVDRISATATADHLKRDGQLQFLETRSANDSLDVFSLTSIAIEHMQRARETGDVSELTLAESALKKSLEIRTNDNYEGVALLAAVSVTKHDFARGLDLAQQAIPQKPKEAYAYGALGDADMGLGRYDDADVAFEKVVTIQPDLSAFGRRALLFTVRGRLDEAEKSWRDAISRSEGDGVAEHAAWAYSQLANLEFAEGKIDDAGADYQRSLDIFPGYVHALAGIGRVAASKQDWPTAIDYYTRAINRIPLPEYVIALGDVYAASGDQTRAQQQFALIAAIEQLYAANGVNLDLQIGLYNADHDRDVASTVERAKNAYAVQPSVQAADVLAWVEFKSGDVPAAREAIDHALATGIQDPLVLFHAGMIYKVAHDNARAKQLLETVEQKSPRFSVLYASTAKQALDDLNAHAAAN